MLTSSIRVNTQIISLTIMEVISGHTHNTHFPPLHDCGTHKLKQIILTSINAQLDWQSDTKYYPVGKPQFIHTVIHRNQRNINLIDL